MSQGKGDMFIGEEIEEMLKRDEKSSVSMKKFSLFMTILSDILEKWFYFSDNNFVYKIQFLSLKKETTYSEFKEAVVLNF
jgi:hypothetical protein